MPEACTSHIFIALMGPRGAFQSWLRARAGDGSCSTGCSPVIESLLECPYTEDDHQAAHQPRCRAAGSLCITPAWNIPVADRGLGDGELRRNQAA